MVAIKEKECAESIEWNAPFSEAQRITTDSSVDSIKLPADFNAQN